MRRTLGFSYLDDLLLAWERKNRPFDGDLSSVNIEEIGPLVELGITRKSGKIPIPDINILPSSKSLEAFKYAIGKGGSSVESLSDIEATEFLRTTRRLDVAEDSVAWGSFCKRARIAATAAGFDKKTAYGLIGALAELEDNVHRHSERPRSGIVGYRATPKTFEFVIGDCGIGVLKSLKSCPDYDNVNDHTAALRTALDLGESRFGRNSGCGTGFNNLFQGLANLHGHLRFRSGSCCLVIDGRAPTVPQAMTYERTFVQGFFASVSCSP